MSGRARLGPGTLRVGRFIGRLGVVSLPAVEVGLDLDERVVRRHVAKLEAAGWLGRAPWVWGEGSVVWLTGAGVQGAGLGGVRAVKSPPAPTTIGMVCSLASQQHELSTAAEPGSRPASLNWIASDGPLPCAASAVTASSCPTSRSGSNGPREPGAVVAESGGRREDRQKMILEGWRDAIWSGRYIAVRYDCASPSVARWIARLAKKVGLTDSAFMATVQTTAEQIAALSPAASDAERAFDETKPSREFAPAPDEEAQVAPARAPAPPEPVQAALPKPAPAPEPETAEAAAERERRYRETFGIDEQKPRRRWRR
jgi:hypothetical protein